MIQLNKLGSEKLEGEEKLKRILELTYFNRPINENKNVNTNQKYEFITEGLNKRFYGIVREKNDYYVKTGLNENELDYIGGLFMKNKNRYNSYAEAYKRLELIKGREELNEATKYVLKNKGSQVTTEEPISEPIDQSEMGDMPTDMGQSDMSADIPSEERTETKPSDYMAEIQKFSGKLGQELRDQKEKMESSDIKYVLNMIISAVDLTKLDDEDIEEIGAKFERDEEDKFAEPSSDIPSPEGDERLALPPSEGEQEMAESMNKLNNFINKPLFNKKSKNEVDLSNYADIDETVELDMNEISNEINKAINSTLSKYFK